MASMLSHRCLAPWLVTAVVAVAGLGVSAQAAEKPTADKSAESEIRAAAASFVDAFNRGDAKAVAAHWTANGALTDERGQVFKGRKAIEDEYAAFFKEFPGVKMEVAIQSLEFATTGAAVEEGVARVLAKNGTPPAASLYTALDVLVEGKWLMASVRETGIELASNYRRLRDLAWLVGKWETKSDTATVHTTVRWLAHQSFLEREFTVQKGGVTESSGIQIIGWDAQAGQVRSWSFDSSGGHGTGLWTPTPEGWRIDSKGMLADGTPTASQDFLIRVPGEDDVLGWRSVKRRIGGKPLADLREVVLERLPQKQTH